MDTVNDLSQTKQLRKTSIHNQLHFVREWAFLASQMMDSTISTVDFLAQEQAVYTPYPHATKVLASTTIVSIDSSQSILTSTC